MACLQIRGQKWGTRPMPPPTWQCGCSAPGRLDHLRGLSASGLDPGQRLLAAADAYQTYLEPRPQRPALLAGTAAARLRPKVSAGRLAEAAVESVLVAAGQQEARRRILPSCLDGQRRGGAEVTLPWVGQQGHCCGAVHCAENGAEPC